MKNPKTSLETITARVRALDSAASSLDKSGAELALASYFALHSLPLKPFVWAEDGQHALRLVEAASELWPANDELRKAQEHVGEILRMQDEGLPTEAQMSKAPSVPFAQPLVELWRLVKAIVVGHDVALSIPWYLYHEQFTPERGGRVTGNWVWYESKNLVDILSWAAHEFIWWRADTLRHKRVGRLHLLIVRALLDAYEAGVWMFWVTATEIIVLPQPVLRLSDGQLHSESAPAVSWQGSEQKYFFLNGVRVPESIVMTPADRLDLRVMLLERNADVRREIIRKVGIERVCEAFNARCIDQQGNYELLLLDLHDGRIRPFLKMKNPSIGVYHIEGVAPECRTVAEALTWRNQSDIPPSVLT